MTLSIVGIQAATSVEWDIVWRECPYATYFHSREWAEIWQVYFNGKIQPEPKWVLFSDKKKALLPLSSLKILKKLAKHYFSSPAGTFGGWISADELKVGHVQLLTNLLTRKMSNIDWRLNPYDRITIESNPSLGKYDETDTLCLKQGFDKVYKDWEEHYPALVRKIKNAEKGGISVYPAVSLDDWRAYFEIYKQSLERWGEKASSEYHWELFEEMHRRNSPHIQLFLALLDHKPVAGTIIFYSKMNAIYWHGAALKEYFHLRPVNGLIAGAIGDACTRKCEWFDFNPSGGHEGVKAFKRSFGARSLPSPFFQHETGSAYFAKKIRLILKGFACAST